MACLAVSTFLRSTTRISRNGHMLADSRMCQASHEVGHNSHFMQGTINSRSKLLDSFSVTGGL